ncbi:GNAT family N-acetyltransferase [Olivibacter ginsenosidimutans]|uniref:GNAT family N-acetyltransferase n=1 Tax=Olivibacter ginsenosidimutans TaxID=1176537 RepID=A0ABP9C8U9_9SPHI
MIEIIAANIQDIKIIQEIAYNTWPTTFGTILSPEQITYMLDMMYSQASLTKQLTDLQHHFLLAKQAETVVGFVSYETPYRGLSQTKIHKIYILPTTQRSGVGRKLMDEVERIARNKGDRQLLLNVNKFNTAENFYKQLGFDIIGMEDIDIGAGFLMEDKIMAKKLS